MQLVWAKPSLHPHDRSTATRSQLVGSPMGSTEQGEGSESIARWPPETPLRIK